MVFNGITITDKMTKTKLLEIITAMGRELMAYRRVLRGLHETTAHGVDG